MASSPHFKLQKQCFDRTHRPDVNLLDQYREKLKKAIGTARFFGLPDRPLEKVFVELTVIEDFEIPRDAEYKALMDKELRRHRTLFPKERIGEKEENPYENYDEQKRTKRKNLVRLQVKPEDLLIAGKHTQVVGAPGCGKTTLLRWLTLHTAVTNDRLPVFIELKTLKNAQFGTIDHDFSVFLFQQGVKRHFDLTDLTTEQFTALENGFHEYDQTGRLVVLLDGLDEIAEAERHRLQTAVEKYSNSHKDGLTLIVSTRPFGYLRNVANLKTVEIEPLSDHQINTFLDYWCEKSIADTVKANLRKNPYLRNLARFPFLLTCIASLESGGDIPRIELYRQIVAGLITGLDRDQGDQKFEIDDPNGVLRHRFLKRFAFDQLFEKPEVGRSSRLVFYTEEILDAARTFLREEAPTISPPLLIHDVCATPLLREIEAGRFMFAHPTIHEFLAAEELSERDDCQKRFARAFFNRQLAEMEVLPMTIGLADDPNEFYDLLSNTPESFDFIRLRLEARSLRYHQKAVRNAHYQKWQVMLTAFGLHRTHRDLLFSEAVLNSFTGIEIRHFQYLTTNFLTALLDQEWQVHQRAAETLVRLGTNSPDLITALCNALRDTSVYVRRRAAEALGKLGPNSPDVITALSNALHDEHWSVRQSAAEVLIQLGTNSTDLIPVLSNALRDQSEYVRQRAAEALGKLDISTDLITVLSSALRDTSRHVSQAAAQALTRLSASSPEAATALSIALQGRITVEDYNIPMGTAETSFQFVPGSPDAVTVLSNALHDQSEYVRSRAAQELGKLDTASPIPPNVLAALSDVVLHDQSRYARLSATEALEKLGADSPTVLAALSNALNDQSVYVRLRATRTLVYLGANSPDIITALSNGLQDEDSDVRRMTAEALGILGANTPDIITALSNGLQDEDSDVRRMTAEALGILGANTPDIIIGLSNASHDQSEYVRKSAVEALGKIGADSPDAIATLSNALHDPKWLVRQIAAEALIKLGANLTAAAATLSYALHDEDYNVRRTATETLVRLGANSSDIIVALSNVLRDEPWIARRNAAKILVQLGIHSPEVITTLSEMLRDKDPYERRNAAETLGRLGVNSPDVITALTQSLHDRDRSVSASAAEALKKLGANSLDLITTLSNALRDTHWDVRVSAIESLERIGFDSSEFCEALERLLSNPDPELRLTALRSIGYESTDKQLLGRLWLQRISLNTEIRKAAKEAHEKYKFKLEMLGLLPA